MEKIELISSDFDVETYTEKQLVKAMKTIKSLREELRRERFVVDFYASQELYEREKDNLFKCKKPSVIEIDQGIFAKQQQLLRKEIV